MPCAQMVPFAHMQHRAEPVPPPGDNSSDEELYDQYDISMEDILGPSPTSSSTLVDHTGSGGQQQGKARKVQRATSPTSTVHPLIDQEVEERLTQEGFKTTGKGKLTSVPGNHEKEISLTLSPVPETILSPYRNVDYADDDDDDGLGEIGDLPCHPLLDEPEPSQSTLEGPEMLKESENLASVNKAINAKAARRAKCPKPTASAHVKASATKDMGQVRTSFGPDGSEQLEWLDMLRKEWRMLTVPSNRYLSSLSMC